MEKKINEIRKKSRELSWLRYMGEVIDGEHDILSDGEYESDLCNYMKTFLMAGTTVKKEIFIAEKLLTEVEEIAKEKEVDVSTLVSFYLLQTLEKNRRTEIVAKGKTKGKEKYILNNLYEGSNFVKHAEKEEEFKNSIFSNRELEQLLTYESTIYDEYIYIEKYLLSKNYTKEQIEALQKEEWKKFGVTENLGIKMVEPYSLELEPIYLGKLEIPVGLVPVYVSVRLGFHYMLLKRNKFKSYEKIEKFLKNNYEGDKKIWDTYKEFLEEKRTKDLIK